ncbi:MAG: glycosyltransferase [Calditrichaeota bacterium]|nr:glycosyltransferase [Calditrichota bacterium]
MNVLMLLDQQFPPDERVMKEAITLSAIGHIIHILCVTYSKQKKYEVIEDVHVHRFYYPVSFHKKLTATYLVQPFHFFIWSLKVRQLLKQYKIDVIHVHDLPLSNVALRQKKMKQIKLVCDQHEYYSNWITHAAHYNTRLGRIVRKLSNWKQYEQKMLSQADLVITVEEPLRSAYIEEIGINPDRIISVPNTPMQSVFNDENIDEEIVKKYQDNFVIFYAGTIDILRGLNLVIESLPQLEKVIPNIKFVLAGRIAFGIDPVEDAKRLGVGHLLDYIGWVPLNKLPSYIKASDICNHTPYTDSDEVNKTIATKIYQYILMQKPIITSRAKMMADLVVTNQIGYSVSTKDEYIDAVKKIYQDKKVIESIEINCQKISDRFTWEKTSVSLISGYGRLEKMV